MGLRRVSHGGHGKPPTARSALDCGRLLPPCCDRSPAAGGGFAAGAPAGLAWGKRQQGCTQSKGAKAPRRPHAPPPFASWRLCVSHSLPRRVANRCGTLILRKSSTGPRAEGREPSDKPSGLASCSPGMPSAAVLGARVCRRPLALGWRPHAGLRASRLRHARAPVVRRSPMTGPRWGPR